ncbi:hypothetical protein [Kineosporia babensis]|uniref:Uncharacterized protein n=1 Tax=Kineosporia babensis TaxID=499548 RepID=A0A9X1NAG2_9ACTN|nr:hypothetical protein [Kineosporia babensis]MCD5310080.1 hypothetical protein [Kineosporia babensis]
MSEPARGSQESGNQLIEGVNAAESQTGALEYTPGVAQTTPDLGPVGSTTVTDLIDSTSTDASFSSSSDGSGPVRLIGEDETSKAMQAAGAAAGSLGADPDATVRAPQPGAAELLSTAGLPDVTGDVTDTGLTLSAASVGAALAATGAPLNMASVSPSDESPSSGSLPVGGDSTEPHPFVPDPAASPVSPPAGNALGGSAPAFGSPSRPGRSGAPDTGAFVPREMVARRRAAEAMTRAIVMAPPLPPSMMTSSMSAPGVATPPSGPITQPDGVPEPAPARPAATRTAKNRKRKGRKQGAHTAGIPLTAPANPQAPAQQPPTGQMPMPTPGTGSVPMGYPAQGYPQGYAPQGYPQGYAPQGYAPQGYAPQGYAPQGYQPNVPTGAMPTSAMGSVGVPTAPPHQQAPPPVRPPARQSQLPSGPARWGMLAAVVLVIGGIIAGVLLNPFGSDDSDGQKGTAAVGPTPTASEEAQAAPTVSLEYTTKEFAEVDEGISEKSDGTYQSPWFKSANFGGLKDGVGLVVDVGSAKEVSEISVEVGGSPITLGLRAADSFSGSNLSNYEKVVAQGSKTGVVEFDASKAGAHQYWLIWVTNLPPDSAGTYRAVLNDIKVTGPES